ncbi:TIGR01777 family oxidoreductase [Mariniblastus fucicola]|nr:TIGR01777 family oxidoreductase [Mariniblastus fucicola]
MKIVIPGGSGQVGQLLERAFKSSGDEVVVLGRNAADESMRWDGIGLGSWTRHVDGADVVINLAGRTVNCRYTEENLLEMKDSRVDSTRVIGRAIANSVSPPKVWLQMSTATIYSHRFDAANDEATGIIGGNEKDTPAYWARSIEIAKAWELELEKASVPQTRKVAMRTAMVMSPDKDGVFDVLCGLTQRWLGGRIGSGKQFVSWIHGQDFVNAVRFLIENESLSGPVNLAAPNPLPQAQFQSELRKALGVGFGLPAMKWMAEIGAVFMRTDTELILKSRRVIPGRLLESGFGFQFEDWRSAVAELESRR